jgi:hypothetical protein
MLVQLKVTPVALNSGFQALMCLVNLICLQYSATLAHPGTFQACQSSVDDARPSLG